MHKMILLKLFERSLIVSNANNEKNIYVQECCCPEEGDTNYQLQSVVIVKSNGEDFVTGGVVYAPVLVLSMLVYSLKVKQK